MKMRTAVINLSRRPERRKVLRASLQKARINAVRWVRAVDGEELRAQGGRARHMGGGRMRLAWNKKGGGRAVFTVRLGKSWSRGICRPWPTAGAILSHLCALKALQKEAGQFDFFMVLEDDAKVPPDLKDKIRKLLQQVPAGWKIIQLGCHTAGCVASKRATVRKLPFGKLRVAERCYQAHCYLLSKAGVDSVIPHLEAGAFPDGALVATQAQELRAKKRTCFWVQPDLVTQNTEFCSDTCTETSWKKALAAKKKVRNENPQGSGKVAMKALKALRSASGARGGAAHAGGGTTAQALEKKKKNVFRWARRNGHFPSRMTAEKELAVSGKPWRRFKAEWEADS
ncbi:unnamed protein product [Effrenium voratum]|nr:unnamed protein product [Effrenium voratum]